MSHLITLILVSLVGICIEVKEWEQRELLEIQVQSTLHIILKFLLMYVVSYTRGIV